MDDDQDGTRRARFVTDRHGVTEIRGSGGGTPPAGEHASGSTTSRWGFLRWVPTVFLLVAFVVLVVGIVMQVVADNRRPGDVSATPTRPGVSSSGSTLSSYTPYTPYVATTTAPPPRGLQRGDCLSGTVKPEIVACDSARAEYRVTGPTRDGLVCPAGTDASFMSLPGGAVCAVTTRDR